MFSGIMADIGLIKLAQDRDGGLRLTVATDALGWTMCNSATASR